MEKRPTVAMEQDRANLGNYTSWNTHNKSKSANSSSNNTCKLKADSNLGTRQSDPFVTAMTTAEEAVTTPLLHLSPHLWNMWQPPSHNPPTAHSTGGGGVQDN